MATPQSGDAAAALERSLRTVPPGTPRHRALSAAHAFKASWVSLGEALSEVRKTHAYKAWGYPQFAAYCRGELHIREETARKLTRSFGYLQEHAPETLAYSREGRGPAPALDVVDLLRQARSRTRIDEAAWAAVQRDALSQQEGQQSRQQVLARLREADPAVFAAPGAPSPAANASDVSDVPSVPAAASQPSAIDPGHARKVLLLAERLHALLAQQPALADDAERAAILALAKSLRRHAALPPRARGDAQSTAKLYSEGALH